jgi:hypothetical protein
MISSLTAGCVPEIQQTVSGIANSLVIFYVGIFIAALIIGFSVAGYFFRHNIRFQKIWVPAANVIRRLFGLNPLYIMPRRYVVLSVNLLKAVRWFNKLTLAQQNGH